MSYGDPNNPYGQPAQPSQPPQPPQQPPTAPGYTYGYGYPQQQPYAGYTGYPGGGMVPAQSMPGLLMTARVFLFIISATQIIGGLVWLYIGAFVNDVTDDANSAVPLRSLDDAGHAAAGALVFIGLVTLAFAALSITLGVKFGNGGQGIRVTTVVYGALGTIIGFILLVVGLDSGMASAVILPLLWVGFGAVITAAPVVASGTAWFARPRY
ncbi:hypothetical protein R6V09_44325 [Streptomyces sp. W16]|uniref:hypothetical protein n=1 Tax=Streptomyces sp. W16 TaxID=3076631 RepID=UPI00295B2C54|nr:hypothetical protein [Streptomyces sp. W16]MDV9177144.1 hypothetical protein [Streptomyces sp. W16]